MAASPPCVRLSIRPFVAVTAKLVRPSSFSTPGARFGLRTHRRVEEDIPCSRVPPSDTLIIPQLVAAPSRRAPSIGAHPEWFYLVF